MRGLLQFSDSSYKAIKKVDFSELGNDIAYDDDNNRIELSNLALFQIILNEEIASKGMNGQDTVNDYGISLYNAYDEMLDQCE